MNHIQGLFFTVGFGIFCLFADAHLGDVVLTPLLGLCWLLVAATRFHWKTVLLLAVVFTLFVIASLAGQGPAKMVVRIASFLVGSGLAIAFSRARERYIHALGFAHAILQGIPIPVVAADVTGQIVVVSNEAIKMIPASLHPASGHSFADVFMGNLPPGHAMKVYLDWFYREGAHSEVLFFRERPAAPIGARVLSTGRADARLLVVTLLSFNLPATDESPAGI